MPLKENYVNGETLTASAFNEVTAALNALTAAQLVTSAVTGAVTLAAVPGTSYVAFVAANGAPVLPTAVGNACRYTIKNIAASNVSVSTTSSQTIDGSLTAVLTPNTSIDAVSDGTNWRVI